MVFDGLAHHLQLFGREPLAQAGVGGEDLSARQVMDGAGPGHPEVVIGGDGIDHIDVGTGDLHQLERMTDDTGDVFHIVGSVEGSVLRQDFCLNELY